MGDGCALIDFVSTATGNDCCCCADQLADGGDLVGIALSRATRRCRWRIAEYILASVSQHQSRKNAEQTLNRMQARSYNGYWVFQPPIGYKYEKFEGHGKLLVRNEPLASIVQEALEGFASGRFDTRVEVKRFLEQQPDFPKNLPNGIIRNQRITDILTRVTYAGYIEVPNWDIPLRDGHHEGLISLHTYEKIQDRLKSGARVPARKNIDAAFPLRGFVLCGDCEKPLTACWSKSSTGKKTPLLPLLQQSM